MATAVGWAALAARYRVPEVQVGIDLSAANGECDLVAAAAWRGPLGEKIAFAIAKATEGNADSPDPQFVRNWRGIALAGLLRGAYHFAHPDSIHALDAADEARRFVAQIEAAGGFRRGRDFLALDVEEARRISKGKAFTDWVILFCETVDELTGCTCGVYSGGPFFDEEDGEPDADAIARLRKRWFWVAAYVDDPAVYVQMTAEWREPEGPGWLFHQRRGDQAPKGEVPFRIAGVPAKGPPRNTDMSVFRGSFADLASRIAGMLVATIPPPPDGALQLGDDGPTQPLGREARAEQDARDAEKAGADETWKPS